MLTVLDDWLLEVAYLRLSRGYVRAIGERYLRCGHLPWRDRIELLLRVLARRWR